MAAAAPDEVTLEWERERVRQAFEPLNAEGARVRVVWPPPEVLQHCDSPAARGEAMQRLVPAPLPPPEDAPRGALPGPGDAPELPPRPERATRFVAVSDTHSTEGRAALRLPPGDVLLHAGDFTNRGGLAEIEAFAAWIKAQPHAEKVVIAGNHDLLLDPNWPRPGRSAWMRAPDKSQRARAVRALRDACVYLDEEEYVTRRGGLRVFGTPWSPTFCDWAFNADRGDECRARWARIPDACDIVVSHGPPLGRGDLCSGGKRAGCADLMRTLQRRVRPLVALSGHIHEAYGASSDGATTYLNASTCTRRYWPLQPAIVFDVLWD